MEMNAVKTKIINNITINSIELKLCDAVVFFFFLMHHLAQNCQLSFTGKLSASDRNKA